MFVCTSSSGIYSGSDMIRKLLTDVKINAVTQFSKNQH